MSATFWNMRRRKRAVQASKAVETDKAKTAKPVVKKGGDKK